MSRQEAENYGWKFLKTCNCGGMYQEHFKKGTMVLKVYVNNNKFEVHATQRVIRKGNLQELQQYFKEPESA